MVLCNKELSQYPEVKLCMQVHDEIVYDCPDYLVDKVASTCYNIICSLDKHIEKYFNCKCNVPFTGDVKTGLTWGETTKWKEAHH